MASRGHHLVTADRGFATGAGLAGRIAAPLFKRLLDRIDRRLAIGGIDGTLPDGTPRKLGFHAPGPVAEVRLHGWGLLMRVATSGSVGLYKSWAKGEWTSPDPVKLFELFMANAVSLGDTARAKGPMRWMSRLAHRLRDNRPARARQNIAAHYDLGNDFYAEWLDPTMSYSAARFAQTPSSFVLSEGQRPKSKGPVETSAASALRLRATRSAQDERVGDKRDTLEAAQLRKVHLLLDRLDLKEGSRLLEIGCGWGTLAIEAARRGARVVGLTLSHEQKRWADQKIAEAQLSDRIEIRLQDYRECDERFDAVASVEMVEAVGERWWPAYLDAIARCLEPGGKAALQLISIDHALFDAYRKSADFIQAYIFPGGMLIDEPSFQALAAERGLGWEDRDGFGLDYAETLKQWRARFDVAVREGRLDEFSSEFHQLWRFYLMYCEGGFRGHGIDVAQVTMVKPA